MSGAGWPRRGVLATVALATTGAGSPPPVSCATRVHVPDRFEPTPPLRGGPTSLVRHVLARGPVETVQLGFANWLADTDGEKPGSGDITVRAALEVPSGPVVPLRFNGASTVVIRPGSIALSDPAPCSLLPGDVFASRSTLWTSAETWVANAELSGGVHPDGFALAAPGFPLVDSGVIGTASRTVSGYGPSLILGAPVGPAPSVAIVGDSIAWGAGDGAGDAARNRGWPERLLANRAGLLNLARNGDMAASFATHAPGRAALLRRSGCDRAVVNYGTNDLGAGYGAEAVKASLGAVWALLAGCGVRRIYQATLLPRTRSAAGYGPGAAQTPVLRPGQREAVNAWLREGPAGLAGVLDAADAVERDGTWQTDMGPLTDDGTHPNSRGAALIAQLLDARAVLG